MYHSSAENVFCVTEKVRFRVFQVGDKVVHPMHGAGVVESIVQKKVDGVVRDYYILKLPNRSMVVMIPTDSSEEIGVRPIVDGAQADRVLASIPNIQVEMTANWNHRYRENMEEKRRPLRGSLGDQGPDSSGSRQGAVYRGTEDASLSQANPHF